MNRQEHMDWAKQRAMEYLDKSSEYYNINDAIASMIKDLGKHEETKGSLEIVAMLMLTVTDHHSAVRFIEGFN